MKVKLLSMLLRNKVARNKLNRVTGSLKDVVMAGEDMEGEEEGIPMLESNAPTVIK